MDPFWYFVVCVIVVAFWTYTDCISFDTDEYEFLIKAVGTMAGIFGFGAYRNTMAQKKQLEEQEDIEDEQDEDDAATDSRDA